MIFHITGHHIIISIMISSDYSCTCIAIYIIYFRLHSPCEKLQCLTPPTPGAKSPGRCDKKPASIKSVRGICMQSLPLLVIVKRVIPAMKNGSFSGDIMGILLTGNKNDWLDLWPCSRAPRLGHGHNGRRSIIWWSTMALWVTFLVGHCTWVSCRRAALSDSSTAIRAKRAWNIVTQSLCGHFSV